MSYTEKVKDDGTIVVKLDTVADHNYFIFRTHEGEIEKVKGATFRKIDEGAYLIKTDGSKLTISMKGEENTFLFK